MKIHNKYSGAIAGSEGIVDYNKKYDSVEIIPFIPKKLEFDLALLRDYIGADRFKPGLTIETSLSEIMEICPHPRARSDSYSALCNYLKDEMDIELIISNRRYGASSDSTW